MQLNEWAQGRRVLWVNSSLSLTYKILWSGQRAELIGPT